MLGILDGIRLRDNLFCVTGNIDRTYRPPGEPLGHPDSPKLTQRQQAPRAGSAGAANRDDAAASRQRSYVAAVRSGFGRHLRNTESEASLTRRGVSSHNHSTQRAEPR
jgi:hypothetical protein